VSRKKKPNNVEYFNFQTQPYNLTKNPFILLAQVTHVEQLVIMEHWALNILADELGDPKFNKVLAIIVIDKMEHCILRFFLGCFSSFSSKEWFYFTLPNVLFAP